MTENYPHSAADENGLPTRRGLRAQTVTGNTAQWWNQPPQDGGGDVSGRGHETGWDGMDGFPGEEQAGVGAHGMGGGTVSGGYASGEISAGADGGFDHTADSAARGGLYADGLAGEYQPAFPPAGNPPATLEAQPEAGSGPAGSVAALPPLPAGMPAPGRLPGAGPAHDPVREDYTLRGDYALQEAYAAGEADPAGAGEWPENPEPVHQPVSRAEARTERSRQDGRRASFLDLQPAAIPATKGFRGLLAGLGMRVAPSADELAERRDMRAVSQHWPGPRTVSVVNGKGGANKTPTTVMLAAVFARNGGGPVLAWDNNETRGTLGWRTEQGPHEATVMDLLPQTADLLSPSAQSALLARFVHHQIEDKFDVLRSKPDVLASEQKITAEDFDALHEVASKYFRLNIVDSGNDESAERWLRMIDHTHQLVIATTTVEEHAEAGALLLEALAARGGRYAELARNAVVIVSQSDRNGTDSQARRVADGFGQLARAAVTIPYDPALRKGQIRYDSLKPGARRAWLAAAAAVAEGL